MAEIARFLSIRGRVQGVGFRWYLAERAERHGVRGWTRNRYDGAVELLAQGEEAAVEALLADAGKGPPMARVDGVDVRAREVDESVAEFAIRETR